MNRWNYFFRVSVTLLRPLPIALEWWLLDGETVLSFAFPVVMLLLAISSIPVHRELYINAFKEKREKKLYANSIFIILCASLLFYCLALGLIGYSGKTLQLLLVWYVIEKVSDELSRDYTYHKKFGPWYVLQTLRSLWVAPAVFLSLKFNYYNSLLLIGLPVSVFCVIWFFSLNKIHMRTFREMYLYKGIFYKFPYLAGGGFSGLVRQGPRMVVNGYFSQISHLYLIVSQCFQIIPILYNVKFQVPYRKLAAKKPRLYASLVEKIGYKVTAVAGLVFTAGSISFLFGYEELAALGYLLSEALLITVLSNKLGILIWVLDPWRHFKIMLLFCLIVASALFIVAPELIDRISIYGLFLSQFVILVTLDFLTRSVIHASQIK